MVVVIWLVDVCLSVLIMIISFIRLLFVGVYVDCRMKMFLLCMFFWILIWILLLEKWLIIVLLRGILRILMIFWVSVGFVLLVKIIRLLWLWLFIVYLF